MDVSLVGRASSRAGIVFHQRLASSLAPPCKKSLQFGEHPGGFQCGRGVNFHAIASRENHHFVGDTGFAQRLERLGNSGLGKGKPLPQFHGRRMVAQADDDNVHFDVGQASRLSLISLSCFSPECHAW